MNSCVIRQTPSFGGLEIGKYRMATHAADAAQFIRARVIGIFDLRHPPKAQYPEWRFEAAISASSQATFPESTTLRPTPSLR